MCDEIIKKELKRCLGCKVSPCQKGCPLGVSPHDFILFAVKGEYEEAAKIIRNKNPLAETCGLVCPDCFCQKACIRAKIDKAIEIPCLQANICKKSPCHELELPEKNGKRIAIIGGGPAGLGACYELVKNGFCVVIFEKENKLGGVARLIPDYRLPKEVLDKEIDFITKNDRVEVKLNSKIDNFDNLRKEFDGVIVAVGEQKYHTLGVEGEEYSVLYKDVLGDVNKHKCEKVCVVGGGEVALDCALSLKKNGAKEVCMLVRRRREDMRIMQRDFRELEDNGVEIRELSSIVEIKKNGDFYNLIVIKNEINEEGKARAILGTEVELQNFDKIVTALGASCSLEHKNVSDFVCGDMTGKAGTVVGALASGVDVAKNMINSLKG